MLPEGLLPWRSVRSSLDPGGHADRCVGKRGLGQSWAGWAENGIGGNGSDAPSPSGITPLGGWYFSFSA
jgi:hypothetical protein